MATRIDSSVRKGIYTYIYSKGHQDGQLLHQRALALLVLRLAAPPRQPPQRAPAHAPLMHVEVDHGVLERLRACWIFYIYIYIYISLVHAEVDHGILERLLTCRKENIACVSACMRARACVCITLLLDTYPCCARS